MAEQGDVRAYFPDAPEQCLGCSGLTACALRLGKLAEEATAAELLADELEARLGQDPEDNREIALAQAASALAVAQFLSIRNTALPTARELYGICRGIRVEYQVRLGWRRPRKPGKIYCGSGSPWSLFIPKVPPPR